MNEATLPLQKVLFWDVVNWSACLDLWEPYVAGDSLECLEIGAGNGGLTLWLASKNHRVLCSDIRFPGPAVHDLHASHSVASRVSYEAIDATQIPYAERFDVVVFKSVLGRILAKCGTQGVGQAVFNMHQALRPGGRLLFAENLRGSWLHRVSRRTLLKRGPPSWQYPTAEQLRSSLRVFTFVDYRLAGFLGAFGRNERQRRWLGRVDRAIVTLVPRNCRYIMFGVATKQKGGSR
jgi:SAM-dependent methyltransferase